MFASLLISIGGCDPEKPKPDLSTRVTLPVADIAGWRRCISRHYPEWPDGDVVEEQVVGQKERSKRLDAAKTACGLQAVAWAESVIREYGK